MSSLTPARQALLRQLLSARGLTSRAADAITARPRADDSVVSVQQARLWVLDQLQPGSPAYAVPAAVRLAGELKADDLARTLTEIVRRHEALRTVFVADTEGRPRQRVLPPFTVALQPDDLRDLPGTDRERELRRLIDIDVRKPFDLALGPPLRVRLFRLAEDEHVVLLVMHHIVCDGWSIGVLMREVSALYEAFASGRPSPLSEPAIQYADYAIWQERALSGEAFERDLAWWREHLKDAPPRLDLPTDRSRASSGVAGGGRLTRRVDRRLTDAIAALGRQEGATLYVTLLAAFQLLLARLSGQSDLCVGCPVANRAKAEVEGLIGCFINTLVMRTDLSGVPSFRALVQRVRATTAEAFARQEAPFERLVAELAPQRTHHRPLVQVDFVLQNAPRDPLRIPGLRIEPLEIETGTAKFDLTLSVTEHPGGLDVAWIYDAHLFDADTIARTHRHFETLLASAVESPERPLRELRMMPADEVDAIAGAWNQTARAHDETPVHELIARQAALRPDEVAVVCAGVSLTFAELEHQASLLASALRRTGLGVEQRVGLALSRGVNLVVAMLGVMKAGGVFVPLDPAAPEERRRQIARDAALVLVLTDDSEERASWTATSADEDAEADATPGATECPPERLAYVLYTSGSSGTPKGVMVTHGSLSNLAQALQDLYAGRDIQRVGWNAAFTFDACVKQWVQLAFGRTVHILDDCTRGDATALCRYVEAHALEALDCTPAHLEVLLDAGLPPMKLLLVGGDAIAPDLWRRLAPRGDAVNVYGPTECTVDASWTPIAGSEPSIGTPIANVRTWVMDDDDALAPIGVPGELRIGGAGVARGYLDDPALTADRFRPDPFGPAGGRLYRTGDRVRWSADRQLIYSGRMDAQIKLRGFRIEPGEIEQALREQPGVSDAAVVLDPAGQRLVAFVTPSSGVSPDDLLTALRRRLPSHIVPAEIRRIEQLPLTRHAKVDRARLRLDAGQTITRSRRIEQPGTPLEELIHGLWVMILERDGFGVTDNFFACGGNSLHATRLVLRIRQTLGVDVALASIFEHPTVATLAASIEPLRRDQRLPPLPAIAAQAAMTPDVADAPLSFAQQRLWFLGQLVRNNSYYNVPIAVRLRGQLNVDALERALTAIVGRHAALRTVFVETPAGEPRQRVRDSHAVRLPVLDLQPLEADARHAEAERVTAEEARRPFDLELGPLWRATLLRFDDREHLILLTLHHIVCDGWSMGVLVREIGAFYAAFTDDRPAPLAEPALQYVDYARWQRTSLSGDLLEAQLQYWRAQLAGAPPVLPLPLDHPRPSRQSFRGARLTRYWPVSLAARLRELSRNEGVTLFMTLLAGFQAVLARYSGETDLCIGTPIANRTRIELESLIGFFVNTLVLRTDLSGDPSFRALLRRVRQVALDAYAHQDLPFERLVDELQPVRALGQNPLFQINFALQNAPRPPLSLPGLTLDVLDVDNATTKFDLTLSVTELPDGLAATLEYACDLFEAPTIARMLDQIETLLRAACEAPETPISRLSMAGAREHARLEAAAHGANVETSSLLPVHHLVAARAHERPEAVAVRCGPEDLTFGRLNAESNRLARYLIAQGVRPEDRVGLSFQRTPEMVVALLAVLKAGAAYVPLDSSHPRERNTYILHDAGIRLVLTRSGESAQAQSQAQSSATAEATMLALDEISPRVEAMSSADAPVSGDADRLAYVLYTSGSTGRPKGVMVTHGGLSSYLRWAIGAYEVEDGAGAPVQSTLAFDLTVTSLLAPLAAGRAVTLLPDEQDLRGLAAVRGASLVKITPAHLDVLSAGMTPDGWPDWTRRVVIGGEALTTDALRQLRAHAPDVRVVNEYGPTETVVGCCVHEAACGTLTDPIPIGKPIDNTVLRVLDRHGELAPPGVPGELFIGGAGVARGYAGRPDLTAERFLPDPFSRTPGARLYRSGDIVRLGFDDALYYLGRTDGQVKIRGYRVETSEIEVVLRDHEAVGAAAVVVDDDQAVGRRLIAAVTPRDGYRSLADERDRVARWASIFDATIDAQAPPQDASFNIAGWTSAQTGQAIPAADMREWVDQTVRRIRDLRPRRVLEIGSGTGLLLFEVAPECEAYYATDLSREALAYAARVAAADPARYGHVQFAQLAAHEAIARAGERLDCIVLNSVVQYFPSADYLRELLTAAAGRLENGGAIFIGDVRSYTDALALHASIALTQARDHDAVADVRERMLKAFRGEEELLLSPRFFHEVGAAVPGITGILCRAKRGEALNELTRFRYDVVLRVEPRRAQAALAEPLVRVAIEDDRTAADHAAAIDLKAAGEDLAQIRRRRLEANTAAVAWNARIDAFAQQGEIIEPCLRPDDSRVHLVARRPDDPLPFFPPSLPEGMTKTGMTKTESANRPVLTYGAGELPALLRDYLAARLPEYMTPARIFVVDRLPLTGNGKIDTSAIAARARDAGRGAAAEDEAAEIKTDTESMLASIWASLLDLPFVGRDDEFFQAGGHSLLATQLVARVRDVFAVQVSLRDIFEAPRLRDLAARVDGLARERTGQTSDAIVAQRGSHRQPLAYAQERLWTLQQLRPESTDFNVPIALRLEGDVSVAALGEAFSRLVERHESLRTVFVEDEAGVSQQTRPPFTPDIEQLEAPTIDEAVAAATAHGRRPFDLRRGPLLRIAIIRIREREHLLAITLHHLISDTWSLGVLIRELIACYEASLTGSVPALSALPIQFGDLAAWQHRTLTRDALERDLIFWRGRLVQLPARMFAVRAAGAAGAGRTIAAKAIERIQLPAELFERVLECSRREHASVFMVLLAAFQVAIAELTGSADVIAATNIANRSRPETQALIGFLANQVVLRGDLSGNPPFRACIAQARARLLEAYAHEWTPFHLVQQDVQPERLGATSALTQIKFNYHELSTSPVVRGLRVTPLALPFERHREEALLWQMVRMGEVLQIEAEADTRYVSAADLGGLLRHFALVLEHGTSDTSSTTDQIFALIRADRERTRASRRDSARRRLAETAADTSRS